MHGVSLWQPKAEAWVCQPDLLVSSGRSKHRLRVPADREHLFQLGLPLLINSRPSHALQRAVKDGKDRFPFEMATDTGKTLTAAAVIKLFLRSGNARRVLFLVDRLELEDHHGAAAAL
jgi:hypothetical protein